jgi:hypothetical protein
MQTLPGEMLRRFLPLIMRHGSGAGQAFTVRAAKFSVADEHWQEALHTPEPVVNRYV